MTFAETAFAALSSNADINDSIPGVVPEMVTGAGNATMHFTALVFRVV